MSGRDLPPGPIERVCTTCLLCLREDTGWSNFTVGETVLHCLAGLNPALEGQDDKTDRAIWGEPSKELAAALDVARECPKYRQGVPAWLDVDHTGFPYPERATMEQAKRADYTDDDEAAMLLAVRINAERDEFERRQPKGDAR